LSSHQPSVTGQPPAASLKRLRWAAWAAVAALAALGALLFVLSRPSGGSAPAASASGAERPLGSWAAGVRRAPGFRLVDQNGGPVSLAAYRGRPVIVTFLDPLCTDFCPLEAKQLNQMLRSLPARSRPAIVAVSVNVYANARATLLHDVADWRLGPEWRWAIGSSAQLARVWRRYQIGVLVTTKRSAGATVHDVSHTEAAYVIDGKGYERALFFWPFRSVDVLAALRRLSAQP
jgi:protein SCO1